MNVDTINIDELINKINADIKKENNANNIQVSFNLTSRCNLNCDYCAARKDLKNLNYKDMQPEIILKSYDKIRKMHPKSTLDLTAMGQGEPLLNWQGVLTIDDIGRKDKNTRLFAITNGTPLVRDRAVELAQRGWNLAISYDGILNELERKGARHEDIEKTIEEVMKASPDSLDKTVIKMTITPLSLSVLKQSLVRLQNIGVKYVMFGPVSPLGKYENKRGLIEDPKKMNSLLEHVLFAEEIGLKPLLSTLRPCGLATKGYYVLRDGRLSICYLKYIKPNEKSRKKALQQGCLLYNLFKR